MRESSRDLSQVFPQVSAHEADESLRTQRSEKRNVRHDHTLRRATERRKSILLLPVLRSSLSISFRGSLPPLQRLQQGRGDMDDAVSMVALPDAVFG